MPSRREDADLGESIDGYIRNKVIVQEPMRLRVNVKQSDAGEDQLDLPNVRGSIQQDAEMEYTESEEDESEHQNDPNYQQSESPPEQQEQ